MDSCSYFERTCARTPFLRLSCLNCVKQFFSLPSRTATDFAFSDDRHHSTIGISFIPAASPLTTRFRIVSWTRFRIVKFRLGLCSERRSAYSPPKPCWPLFARSCSSEQVRWIAGKCNLCRDSHRNQTVPVGLESSSVRGTSIKSAF
jgi:hypothetical protein